MKTTQFVHLEPNRGQNSLITDNRKYVVKNVVKLPGSLSKAYYRRNWPVLPGEIVKAEQS